MAGIRTEIWTKELVNSLSQAEKDTFLSKILDSSRHVSKDSMGNESIHLTAVGAEPEVLVNNTTYPIEVITRTDSDIAITLKKFETKNTAVTQDELYAIAYDKIRSVLLGHVSALKKKRMATALHALAPQSHTKPTPVIKTTGDTYNGLHKITMADIINLKDAFDQLEVPEEGRILVLSSQHQNQLLQIDQVYRDQYYNANRGRLAPMQYGFEIHSHVSNPYFLTNGNNSKLSFGARATTHHSRASIAFYAPSCFKAEGTTEMYYQKRHQNPTYRRAVVGFTARAIVLPKQQKYIGAIISAA